MASSPSIYLSVPTSPTGYEKTISLEYFYSAPPSPRRTEEKQQRSDFSSSVVDDFEFETSKKFDYTTIVGNDNDDDLRRHERGDSLPSMAFADELFVNGLVMPLKLPPRLQCDSDLSFSQKSPNSSPKSPRTVCKLPFARRNIWNDDFDPFKVALEKVREEKRSSYHRRSMSQHLPFRIMSKSYSTTDRYDQDEDSRNSLPKMKPDEVLRPSFSGPLEGARSPPKCPTPKSSFSGPLDFKGSAYARWARAQIQEGALSPRKSPRGFLFGHKVRPVKAEHDCLESSVEAKGLEDKHGKAKEESKVQKIKGVMLKYASFGRETSAGKQTQISSEPRKAGYFSRLSFKLKGNGSGSVKKKSVHGDEKMVVVEYKAKPSLGLCLGYGVDSPGNMK